MLLRYLDQLTPHHPPQLQPHVVKLLTRLVLQCSPLKQSKTTLALAAQLDHLTVDLTPVQRPLSPVQRFEQSSFLAQMTIVVPGRCPPYKHSRLAGVK